MRLFNGMPMPYHLRLTGTTFEDLEHSGREHEEWGNVIVKDPGESESHLVTKEERELFSPEEIQEKIYQDKELEWKK